jgi:hypothetical protein
MLSGKLVIASLKDCRGGRQITIDTFFYCNSFDMPTEFWPRDYDSVLQNELMKAVGEDGELAYATASEIAKSVINAGFSKEAANG